MFTGNDFGRMASDTENIWSGTARVTQSDVKYVYTGMQVVEERDAGTNAILAKYTWGPGWGGGIGGLLSRTVKDGGGTDHHYYYCYDGSGNVMALLNASQDPVARYDYDAFGNTISTGLATGDTALTDATDLLQQIANPYRFSTKRLHASLGLYDNGQTGLYDFGFRFYSPNLGRWINHDPIGEAGGANLYGFVGNNPINSWDAYGHGMFGAADGPDEFDAGIGGGGGGPGGGGGESWEEGWNEIIDSIKALFRPGVEIPPAGVDGNGQPLPPPRLLPEEPKGYKRLSREYKELPKGNYFRETQGNAERYMEHHGLEKLPDTYGAKPKSGGYQIHPAEPTSLQGEPYNYMGHISYYHPETGKGHIWYSR